MRICICISIRILKSFPHPLICVGLSPFICTAVRSLSTVCTHADQWLNVAMGFAIRVRSAGQKYGPTCHQRDRADVTEFVTLVRLSSLGQHVGVLALAGYKRRKSALTADTIPSTQFHTHHFFHDCTCTWVMWSDAYIPSSMWQ